MLRANNTKKITIGALFLGFVLLLTDCTSMITEEQLAELQNLRKRENMLNDEISAARNNLNSLKSELNARMNELNNCNKDKEFVTNKLSQWPNVWPDSK